MKQSMLMDCIAAKYGETEEKRQKKEVAPTPEGDAARIILVAEDNQINQRVAVLQLKQLGLHADVVGNGAQAIAACQEQHYDLILMDCQMPIMDGFEATREIRKAEIFTGKHVPIVAMTAHAMEGDRERCIAEGMDDYISKPVNPTVLSAMLDKWLQIQVGSSVESAKSKVEEEPPKRKWDVNSPPPIDVAKLEEIIGAKEEVGRMVERFNFTIERGLKNLNIAIQDHDMIKIRSVAYDLNQTCLSAGADELFGISENITKVAMEKNWTQCKILFEAFKQAMDVIIDFSNNQAVSAES